VLKLSIKESCALNRRDVEELGLKSYEKRSGDWCLAAYTCPPLLSNRT